MLSEKIKELRLARGLSQVELAKKLSVTKQTVSNWENDNILPSIDMLTKLADYFNVSCDYILDRTPTSFVLTDGLSPEEIAHISLLIEGIKKLKNL